MSSGPSPGDDRRRIGEQLADQADGAGRGRHDLAGTGGAQAELQLVVGVGVAPGRELVGPGRVELVPAQAVGLLGREAERLGAVGPAQAEVVGLGERRARPGRPLQGRHGELAHVGRRLGDDRDPPGRAGPRPAVDRLGPAARLAEAPTGQEQPGPPGSPGRQLLRTGEAQPVRAGRRFRSKLQLELREGEDPAQIPGPGASPAHRRSIAWTRPSTSASTSSTGRPTLAAIRSASARSSRRRSSVSR